jgi:hypothetical protein
LERAGFNIGPNSNAGRAVQVELVRRGLWRVQGVEAGPLAQVLALAQKFGLTACGIAVTSSPNIPLPPQHFTPYFFISQEVVCMNKRKLGFVIGAIAMAFVLAACASKTVTVSDANGIGVNVNAPVSFFSSAEQPATNKLEAAEQNTAPAINYSEVPAKAEEKAPVTINESAKEAAKTTEKVAAQEGHHCSGMYGADD